MLGQFATDARSNWFTQRQNRAREDNTRNRLRRLRKDDNANTLRQMQIYGKAVPIGRISSDITGAYKSAADRIANLYKNNKSSDIYKSQEAKARGDLAPWRTAGLQALENLQSKIAAGPGNFETSPGYEFRKNEGLAALDSSAAARGGALSGRAIKEATRFNQNYASNEYDKFIDRFYRSLDPLQNLSASGQNAANRMGSFSMEAARGIADSDRADTGQIANALMFGAQGTERGLMAKANALTSAYSAALQSNENERARTDARESELRSYDEAMRLRRAAALEKRRKNYNRVSTFLHDDLASALMRSSQMPYY